MKRRVVICGDAAYLQGEQVELVVVKPKHNLVLTYSINNPEPQRRNVTMGDVETFIMFDLLGPDEILMVGL